MKKISPTTTVTATSVVIFDQNERGPQLGREQILQPVRAQAPLGPEEEVPGDEQGTIPGAETRLSRTNIRQCRVHGMQVLEINKSTFTEFESISCFFSMFVFQVSPGHHGSGGGAVLWHRPALPRGAEGQTQENLRLRLRRGRSQSQQRQS